MRKYTLDKKTGSLVETTSEKDKATAEALRKDAVRVRRGMKNRTVQRMGGGYPYESETMAIEPEDIPRARDIARSHGVNTDYTPTGEPIITSRAHQIAHMRAFGYYERNGTTSPRNR